MAFALTLASNVGATVNVVHFSNVETDATKQSTATARETIAESALNDTPEVELVDNHVVMGHHGSGAVGRAILGSAAETVVCAESVPVTAVP